MANNLPLSSLKDFCFAIPPKNEAAAISAYLDSETSGVQKSVTILEREIDLLREYRTRLIADVVTGKLDVREAAARLPELECASADEPVLAEMEASDEELAEENI